LTSFSMVRGAKAVVSSGRDEGFVDVEDAHFDQIVDR